MKCLTVQQNKRIMSAPTVTSMNEDRSTDRAMGWSSQASGGRGKRGYEMQLTSRQLQRVNAAKKVEKEKEKIQRKKSTDTVTEILRKADAGELDWM